MLGIKEDSAQTARMLEQIAAGDPAALDRLLERTRPELLEFVKHRFDPRLRARFNESDVVQETQMEVMRRVKDYLQRRPMPFHLWVRKTAYERLLNIQRDHRRARRSPAREVPLSPDSSLALARPLIAPGTSPSARLVAREKADRVGQAVAQLSEIDGEILLMRHVEDLPYEEIACLLDIEAAAARRRYGRALIRLQRVLGEFGLLE